MPTWKKQSNYSAEHGDRRQRGLLARAIMHYALVFRLLGVVAWLIGVTMLFSVPWALPALGGQPQIEWWGIFSLVGSTLLCLLIGWGFRWAGRNASGVLYRKEAMAVVGLSWVLATILGALPYYFAGTGQGWANKAHTQPIRMTLIECMFESQSGFSTTGATVLEDIEDVRLVPRCILFWRSSTHFLGGLGIIVLFVAVLGHGSAGKALMRAEMPGPSKEGSQERMQHTAWIFAAIYLALNVILTIILFFEGMDWFDAICHAFGTMATGGFSTYNKSIGHFNSSVIDYTITVFMILAGTNFTLLYLASIGKPGSLLKDVEWRTFIVIIFGVTAMLVAVAMVWHADFNPDGSLGFWSELKNGIRYGLFQVVSIVTTTGYGTTNFDQWNQFSRAVLFLLMYVGGCAGSTGGGMKVIRHILFVKILRLEIEQSFHPNVVRHLRLGGEPVTDPPDLRKQILLYFGLVTFVFMLSWITLVAIEDDSVWTNSQYGLDDKLIDSASAVVATLNNIGPGLGTVGTTENYAVYSDTSKLLFIFLMMLGRLELFSILVLLVPSFWRSH